MKKNSGILGKEKFHRSVIIDTEVLEKIDRSHSWGNPQYNLRYKKYDVVMLTPNPKANSKVDIEYESGDRRGEKDRVNYEDITGNNGDLYLETDKVMIVCPRDYRSAQLYGRFPDPKRRAKISGGSNWPTACDPKVFTRDYYNQKDGLTVYIALPKVKEAVLPDKEKGKEDRFAKVQYVIDRHGEITKLYDMYDSKGVIPDKKFLKELRKAWNIPADKVGN